MEIQFTNPDPSKSSFNCRPGEVDLACGCRRYSDGIYRSLPRKGEYTLADGLRLLGVHSMADSADCTEVYLFMTGGPDTEQRELFYLTDHEKEALPCSRPLIRRMMHPICTAVLPSFPPHTALGRTMCIGYGEPSADNPGILHLRWEGTDRGYTVIAGPMAQAEIEFGMVKEGTLSSNGATALSRSGSQMHPETSDTPAASTTTLPSIAAVYTDAVARQAEAKGFFTRPFLVRHALRLPDGSHTALSAPVLMTPWLLPPCIAVSADTSGDGDALIPDLGRCPYFSLQMRLRTPLPPQAALTATALDIFATPMFDTVDTSHTPAGVTTYAHVASGYNSGGRGRRHIGNNADVVAGVYDDGDGTHRSHTVAELDLAQTRCLDLRPNPHLAEDIAAAGDFYRIASINIADLHCSDSFYPVPVASAAFANLRQMPRLRDMPLSGAALLPAALHTCRNRVWAGGGYLRLSPPPPLRAMQQFRGPASAPETLTATLTVVSALRGTSHAVTAVGLCCADADAMPHYVYYPDASATLMEITRGSRSYRMPLAPHPVLAGAFWHGVPADCEITGMQTIENPEPQEPGASETVDAAAGVDAADTVDAAGLVMASRCGNTLVPDPDFAVDTGRRVTALCAAVETPMHATYGSFPIYAFTSGGIFAVDPTARKAVLCHLMHDEISQRQLTPWRDSVVFIEGDRLMRLAGSKVQEVTIAPITIDFDRLPRIRQVLRSADFSPPFIQPGGVAAATSLAVRQNTLIISGEADEGSEWEIACDPDTGEWWLPAPSTGGKMLLATRPLRNIAETVHPFAIDVIAEEDEAAPTYALALWGSYDCNRWQLVQTSRSSRIEVPYAPPRTAYRLVVITDASGLYGISISWHPMP